ncbi:MAG: hypothetical protein PHS19_03260 [Eubacteriales bacterium]|nr:hypothetical protein [Eubacteriales bacterium]
MNTNKKINVKKIVIYLIIAVLVISGAIFCYILGNWGVFRSDRSSKYISQYYAEKENTLDGIVFGSSAAYRYWCPPEAFERHGMAVYCYGLQSMPIFAIKYYVSSALDTQSPKFIAIELRTVTKNPGIYQTGHVLTAVNRMPNSIERTSILAKFMEFSIEHDTRIRRNSSVYGFPEDNGRAEHAEATIIEAGQYKGYIPYGSSTKKSFDVEDYPTDGSPIDEDYEKDLQDLLDYCDNLDCDVIFFATPFCDSGKRIRQMNYAIEIVEDRGYAVINMNENSVIKAANLDFSKDFFNSTHTNEVGAIKVTDYLSNIFLTLYDLPDHRGDKDYYSWEKSYEKFAHKYK